MMGVWTGRSVVDFRRAVAHRHGIVAIGLVEHLDAIEIIAAQRRAEVDVFVDIHPPFPGFDFADPRVWNTHSPGQFTHGQSAGGTLLPQPNQKGSIAIGVDGFHMAIIGKVGRRTQNRYNCVDAMMIGRIGNLVAQNVFENSGCDSCLYLFRVRANIKPFSSNLSVTPPSTRSVLLRFRRALR